MVSEGWSLERETDEFTDEIYCYAVLITDDMYNTKQAYSTKQVPIRIVVGHIKNVGLSVFIETNFFISGDETVPVPVRYRFDADKAIEERWQILSNDNGDAVWTQASSEFIAALQSKKELLFEITDDMGKSYRNRFRGLDKNADNLKQVVDACQP